MSSPNNNNNSNERSPSYQRVALDTRKIRAQEGSELEQLARYRRITDYLSASQLYLKDNFALKRKLQKEDIKDRLLGHWGTCPGINLVYSHCNYLVRKHDLDMFLVVGPGHGGPAVLANLFLEGALEAYYSDYTNDRQGLEKLLKFFSWPGGFPSHVNAECPGTIHEGGELGYCLSVSYGAVMDNPNLIVTCIVGDGEAETGPLSTSWHSHKFIDPKESGAVIPILHLNGFKISSSTLFGCMSDDDLTALFSGYGYQVRIVEDLKDLDADMATSLEWALSEIKGIQTAARQNRPLFKPRWPMLIMKTPKGMNGAKLDADGAQIEGTWRSHGIPLKDPKTNPANFRILEEWLSSYKFSEFVDENDTVDPKFLEAVLPPVRRRLGFNVHTRPKYRPLDLPSIYDFSAKTCSAEDLVKKDIVSFPTNSITEIGGHYLSEVIKRNPSRFRIFSPDELESNKLDGVFRVTHRNNQWQKETANNGGRVIEILSEHTCQGWMQGYSLTGRFSLFPSYETFLGIITTMMIQYAKFIKIAMETTWRTQVPSLNYLETSTLWRQEHNGFSHQDPMFINNVLNLKSAVARIYFPADSNCFVSTLDHCLSSANKVNLIVSTKNPAPVLLPLEEAVKHCVAGASIWRFCSTDDGRNPDVVLVGIGNETNLEVVEACRLLAKYCPTLRVRMVNVNDLMMLDLEMKHPHSLNEQTFCSLFGSDRPVIWNFHGYPSALRSLLFGRRNADRFKINGYIEEGTTTTPFKMLTANQVSRFHVAIQSIQAAMGKKDEVALTAQSLISNFQHALQEHDRYIQKHGKDPENINRWVEPLLDGSQQRLEPRL